MNLSLLELTDFEIKLLWKMYIFFHALYVYMCRHVYVYEYDCFMYAHMCLYCVCMYSTVRIPCQIALYKLDLLLVVVVSNWFLKLTDSV